MPESRSPSVWSRHRRFFADTNSLFSSCGYRTISETVRMRARDKRAIAFCVVTTTVLCLGVGFVSDNWWAAAAATIAYAALILTRPRMIRVFQRIRGDDVDSHWQSYFRE